LSARGPDAARTTRARTAVAADRHRPSHHARHPAAQTGPRHGVSAAKRASLLAATVQSVAAGGYAQLSVTNVLVAAEVSRATFYKLFTDREDVFLAAFDEAVAQLEAAAAEAYAGGGSWEQRLRAGLEAALGALDDQPTLARLCVVEAQRAGPRLLTRRTEIVERLTRIVAEGGATAGKGAGKGSRGADPPPLTAHGLVAGALWVIHERLIAEAGPLSELAGPLMSMIVFPYRGPAAAAEELRRPARVGRRRDSGTLERTAVLEELGSRLTHRTLQTLTFVAGHPGASNRDVANGVGIPDRGQISRLLGRLAAQGLIENSMETPGEGLANAWRITPKGEQLRHAVSA
jgi:AcrR family transcriptional regulator